MTAGSPAATEPITAIVLIRAQSGRIGQIGERIADVGGVVEADTVAGVYDFVALVHARTHEELVGAITESLNALPGVERTLTRAAFKRYSRHDLSRMWSLGRESGDPPAGPPA